MRPNDWAERHGCRDLSLALYFPRVRSSEVLGGNILSSVLTGSCLFDSVEESFRQAGISELSNCLQPVLIVLGLGCGNKQLSVRIPSSEGTEY